MILEIPEYEKAEPAIFSRDRGKQIVRKEEQNEKTVPEISFSFDSDSNANDESELHREKHERQRISTEAGIHTDCNDEQPENTEDSI
jgi:hypothetical protein